MATASTLFPSQFSQTLFDLRVKAVFNTTGKQLPDEQNDFLNQENTTLLEVRKGLITGIPVAQRKPIGEPIQYGAPVELGQRTTTIYTYGLGLKYVEEMDADPTGWVKRFAPMLRKSCWAGKQQVCANILNRSCSGSYTGLDGKALCATDHPKRGSSATTWSNKLASPANLSFQSYIDMMVLLESTENDEGFPCILTGAKLLAHWSKRAMVHEILKSTDRPDTANRAVNAIKAYREVTPVFLHFLTATAPWWVQADDHQMFCVSRKPLRTASENDFDTGDLKFKAWESFACDWTDARGIAGTEGI